MPFKSLPKNIQEQSEQTVRQQFDSNFQAAQKSIKNQIQAQPEQVSAPNQQTVVTQESEKETSQRLFPDMPPAQGIRVGRKRDAAEDQRNQDTRKTLEQARECKEVIRARQKLQRTCNHKYLITTGRCEWCAKKKTSMVYD